MHSARPFFFCLESKHVKAKAMLRRLLRGIHVLLELGSLKRRHVEAVLKDRLLQRLVLRAALAAQLHVPVARVHEVVLRQVDVQEVLLTVRPVGFRGGQRRHKPRVLPQLLSLEVREVPVVLLPVHGQLHVVHHERVRLLLRLRPPRGRLAPRDLRHVVHGPLPGPTLPCARPRHVCLVLEVFPARRQRAPQQLRRRLLGLHLPQRVTHAVLLRLGAHRAQVSLHLRTLHPLLEAPLTLAARHRLLLLLLLVLLRRRCVLLTRRRRGVAVSRRRFVVVGGGSLLLRRGLLLLLLLRLLEGGVACDDPLGPLGLVCLESVPLSGRLLDEPGDEVPAQLRQVVEVDVERVTPLHAQVVVLRPKLRVLQRLNLREPRLDLVQLDLLLQHRLQPRLVVRVVAPLPRLLRLCERRGQHERQRVDVELVVRCEPSGRPPVQVHLVLRLQQLRRHARLLLRVEQRRAVRQQLFGLPHLHDAPAPRRVLLRLRPLALLRQLRRGLLRPPCVAQRDADVLVPQHAVEAGDGLRRHAVLLQVPHVDRAHRQRVVHTVLIGILALVARLSSRVQVVELFRELLLHVRRHLPLVPRSLPPEGGAFCGGGGGGGGGVLRGAGGGGG
eukprot:Rhum_TRINITY_DN11967_c1_g1::Rhum_TRINITY_DN11967_c1_g1_i1::g.48236::m.48236